MKVQKDRTSLEGPSVPAHTGLWTLVRTGVLEGYVCWLIVMDNSSQKHRAILLKSRNMRIRRACPQIGFVTMRSSLQLISKKLNAVLKGILPRKLWTSLHPLLPPHCTVWLHRRMTRPVMGSRMSCLLHSYPTLVSPSFLCKDLSGKVWTSPPYRVREIRGSQDTYLEPARNRIRAKNDPQSVYESLLITVL